MINSNLKKLFWLSRWRHNGRLCLSVCSESSSQAVAILIHIIYTHGSCAEKELEEEEEEEEEKVN